MARTQDPHAAAIKSWQTRRRQAKERLRLSGVMAQPGGGGTGTASRGDWAKSRPRTFDSDAPSEEEIRQATGGRFGREDIADLAGALPGSLVMIGRSLKGEFDVEIQLTDAEGNYVGQMVREINTQSGTIHNALFEITHSKQGQGIGTAAFALQVDAAIAHGFDQIKATCEGGGGWNGYYTWARLGFDGEVFGPNVDKQGYRERLSVHEIMMRPGGAQWWKENGGTFKGTFDLSEGSVSRRVFDEYLRLKGQS